MLRAVAEASRSKGDKSGRQLLGVTLMRLFYFEELPPEAMQLLMPLFQVPAVPLQQNWQAGCRAVCCTHWLRCM